MKRSTIPQPGTRTARTRSVRRRGAAAVLAMMFLMLMTTLTLAMYAMSSSNVQSASNLADVTRAQGAAEAGVRWMAYRFAHMARPKTTVGNITQTVANSLWPSIQTAIVDDITTSANKMLNSAERPVTTTSTSLSTSSISTETNGPTFTVNVKQDPSDATQLIVTSTGQYRAATRSVSMTFKIDKKIKFAIVGKVPVQLGRNTIVEGNIAVATTTKYPPIQMISDFYRTDFDSAMATKISTFESLLKSKHVGYDGRINVNNATEYAAAKAAGFTDYNKDGFVDEYDIFAKQYDKDGDLRVSKSEFTNPSTGQLYESNLFAVIDNLGAPLYTGDPTRDGYLDNYVDNKDGYAKVRGTVTLAMTASAWQTQIGSGGSINDYMQGPITPDDPNAAPTKFGADPSSDMIDLSPANFEQATQNYKNQTGTAGGHDVGDARRGDHGLEQGSRGRRREHHESDRRRKQQLQGQRPGAQVRVRRHQRRPADRQESHGDGRHRCSGNREDAVRLDDPIKPRTNAPCSRT